MHIQEKPSDYHTQNRSEMKKYVPETASKILEVGCGEGTFLSSLKSEGRELWGLELDSEAGNKARQKVDKVMIGNVLDLISEIPDSFFDCIVLNDIIEHLADPFSFLLKIKTKLSKDGVLVCSIPNVRYLPNLFNLLIKKDWTYVSEGILDRTHLRFFTQNSIFKMFNDLDYSVSVIEGINGIESWKFKIINVLFLGFLSDTKFIQFACVAKPVER